MKLRKCLALLAATLLVAVPLAACSVPTSVAGPTATPAKKASIDIKPMAFKPVDTLDAAVSGALKGFSTDLFKRVVAADAGKNVFLSPLSAWLALSMTYNGASGTTAEGMAKALHAAGIPIKSLNEANAGLMGVLTAADPKVTIDIANSIWMRKGLESAFEQSFLDADQQNYAAQIQALDFNQASAADTINAWVDKKTGGTIKSLVQPPIDPATVMFLINAVYFNAPWTVSFDPKKTMDGMFTASSGSVTNAKFMFNSKHNNGYSSKDVTAVRLPYASGRLEMAALMPRTQSLKEFIAALTPEYLDEVLNKCSDTEMPLTFPKFKFEYSASLNDSLKAMGMQDAFNSSVARFGNMSKAMADKLFISDVKHKAFISVTEEGTKAGAATSVQVAATAARMDTLEFTKPFVYLIRDTKTGAILFMGALENPA